MNSFRLTQNQIGKNLYLFPIGDGCNTGLTPFPNTGESNYEDVDDTRLNPDEDITYVHNNTDVVLYDLYDVDNHTIQEGTINYVQVYARAKSHLYAPNKTATFKILFDDSTCADTQKSDDITIVTTYSKYNHVWRTNPYTGLAFEWAEIDAYQCGVEFNSPIISGKNYSLTLRPNAAGSKTNLAKVGAATNWECVDDVTHDGSTFVWIVTGPDIDLYNVPNHTTEAGDITSVTVFARVFAYQHPDETAIARPMVKTGGVEFKSGDKAIPSDDTWHLVSETWNDNPNGGAWSWADIDALEIGMELERSYGAIRCTQVYAVVDYISPGVNPDVRVTQCYMKVNYDETVHCDLNMPEEISQDYAQNIKMLNHWSGNRSVYGLARSKDTTVMLGWEVNDSTYDDEWCDVSYDRRKKITIDHNQVDGDLADFPVYLDMTLDEPCLNDDGYDIMFCDSACSNYSCEIEHYDKLSRRLRAWVKIPTVSSTVDTDFWIYYRKIDVTDNPSSTAVWVDYSMVQHMTDKPDTSNIEDSTSNDNDGTKVGANEPNETNSIIHKGQQFDGINDCINCGNDASLNISTSFTITAWYKKKTGKLGLCLSKGNYGKWDFFGYISGQANFRSTGFGVSTNHVIGVVFNDETWIYLTITYDESEGGNNLHFYKNGVLVTEFTETGGLGIGTDDLFIGKTISGAFYNHGDVDEIHILSNQKNIDWIKAEYANQKEGSTFLSYDVEETHCENTDACEKLKCVEELGKQGDPVTLTGFSYSDYNDEYQIISWGWKKISDTPVYYEWILELERTT